ncbi:MAG: transposase, partial [Oculatellaceae cyanobacterium Prado106]|nr:transposase [Oculatellaceae cyanobacterium Prado106]
MMTPTKTDCNSKFYSFGQLARRKVVADFSGGHLTQDGGLLFIAQLDQHYRVSERLATCFQDEREPTRVEHELKDLLAQRLYGLVQGYEDLNDHDVLRQDAMFGIAVGKLESGHERCAPLAGKSTLNRLEQAMPVKGDFANERY